VSREDPVDNRAMIFTESDVYMIAGFLAGIWGVPNDVMDAEHIEMAITRVLSEQRHPLT
jgi:hypothetical protein